MSVTDSSTCTMSTTVAVTSGNVPLVSSPLLVQAKPKAPLKTTTVASATKKVTSEGVKSLLGKTKLKLQEGQAGLTAQQQIARLQAAAAVSSATLPTTTSVATSPKKAVELAKAVPTSIVQTRTVLQEAIASTASAAKPQPPTVVCILHNMNHKNHKILSYHSYHSHRSCYLLLVNLLEILCVAC